MDLEKLLVDVFSVAASGLSRPITSGTSQLNWLMTLWIALLPELLLGASRELQWFPGGKLCFLFQDFGFWMFASWLKIGQFEISFVKSFASSNTSKKIQRKAGLPFRLFKFGEDLKHLPGFGPRGPATDTILGWR